MFAANFKEIYFNFFMHLIVRAALVCKHRQVSLLKVEIYVSGLTRAIVEG